MDHFATRNRWPKPSTDIPIDYPAASPGEVVEREPGGHPTPLTGSRTLSACSKEDFEQVEEREPGPTPLPSMAFAGMDRPERPGSRLRFVAERGGGSSGTAYNKMDWEVIDHNGPPGRALVCRATHENAALIANALNWAFLE